MHSKISSKIFIITGPSGVGKDTVMRHLERFNLPLKRVTTTTSRPMRPNESQGNPYHFVNENEFQAMVERGEFAEHAKVFNSYKGITKVELNNVLESGKSVLLQTDYQGARTIKRHYPEARVLVIEPPSIQILNQRLRSRGDKQADELKKRIEQNANWRQHYAEFEHFVSNPDGHPELAAEEIAQIVSEELGDK
jgi:guanylate kinase